jgi:hypothetical protein
MYAKLTAPMVMEFLIPSKLMLAFTPLSEGRLERDQRRDRDIQD